MNHITVVGLGLFSMRRRGPTHTNDLDVALAGAQVGLEKKRQRWLLFLIEKEEQCLNQIAQTTELDGYDAHEEPSGNYAWSVEAQAQDAHGS